MRGSSPSLQRGSGSEASILTIRTSNGASTTSGRRTASPNLRTRCLPSRWTGTVSRTASGLSRCTLLEGKGGVFCIDGDIAEVVRDFSLEGMGQILSGVLPWAIDPDVAARLWRLSEE